MSWPMSAGLRDVQEHVVLWCAGQAHSLALVDSAARGLAAGLDGEALCELAGLSRLEARVRSLDQLKPKTQSEKRLLNSGPSVRRGG